MYGLLWTMSNLKRKQHFCFLFVTDSKEFTAMVTELEEWSSFQSELSELAKLRNSFPVFAFVHRPMDKNKKTNLVARNARKRKNVFSCNYIFIRL